MKITLVSGAYPRREVVARGISHKLGGIPIQIFICCEDLLVSSMDYQVFIVYNNFEHKMGGVAGVREIRKRAPKAFIIGVSPIPYMERQFLPAGADVFLLLSGNEITELANFVLKHHPELAPAAPIAPVVTPPFGVPMTAPELEPVPAAPPPVEDPLLHVEELIIVLERARLLLDYALTDPQPAEIHPHLRKLMSEIETIVTRYYVSRDASNSP